MSILSRFVQFLVVTVAVNGSPLERRGVGTLPAHEIVGLPEAVPNNMTGLLYKTYQPFLHVLNGCLPFPAVDINGNINEGLPTTGGEENDCSSSVGQIYARGFQGENGSYAILYSVYMPVDSPSPGLGHRHEWEGVIIWLASSSSTTADNILAVCPSAHGGWNCSTEFLLHETGALLAYFSIWPVNHQMGLSAVKGGQQPLVAWESMSDLVKGALQTGNYSSATVPFKDSTFRENIAKATF
ncbi:hypothetical protein BUE80_DR005297 [Diplocarpon rosae]|nr:hypothetical protein BUE80_DR005297 [Diplocarpon rosae]